MRSCLRNVVIGVVVVVVVLVALSKLFPLKPTITGEATPLPGATAPPSSPVAQAPSTAAPASPTPVNPFPSPRVPAAAPAPRAESPTPVPPAASATPAAPPAVRDACTVVSSKLIAPGGDQDWSRTNGLIAFDQTDHSGVYQLHTIKPDGTDDRCLSCTAAPGAPRTDRHKFNPVWDPTGQFIVLQGELDKNPLDWAGTNKFIAELLLNGVWTDLYATTPNGDKWYKLTNTQTPQTDGVLGPSFSADGSKLFWSHLIAPASSENPWGLWRLMIADFVVRDGVPSLQNARDVTPPGGKFYEAHGIAPDNHTVVFTSDIGTTSKWEMNIWTMDLTTGKLSELTKNGAWNEHAHYTPDGKKIVYMSSQPYPGTVLKTDLMLMSSDGSDKMQLTHFNTPGYPEYSPDQSTPGRAIWNAEGTQLSVTAGLTKTFPSRRLFILTFAGACGM